MKHTKVELTEDDLLNIIKWLTATSMMIEGKLRTGFTDSERNTISKIRKAQGALENETHN